MSNTTPAGGQADVSDEIHPYVIYRIDRGRLECALWQLVGGQQAIALFLSGDAATSYRESARLGAGWEIFRPDKGVLLRLLKSCAQGGIGYAVLDPDLETAKRVFVLREILGAVRE